MKKLKEAKMIVPDTSVLIKGTLSELVSKGELKNVKIIIPRAVLDELQAQSSRGREIGIEGLEEIKKLRELGAKNNVSIEFTGTMPTLEEIQLAKKGRIDAIIKDVAAKAGGILLTADFVQALVAEAEGVPVKYIEDVITKEKLDFEAFFDDDTQSVHLKQGISPYAKKGKPGKVDVVHLGDKKLTEKDMESFISEILNKTRKDEHSFIEIGKRGAMVVQLGNYRISITRPPFSDAIELTAVRPIVKLSLDDYKLHKELEKRIVQGSQGVLIAGPPGSGKSTFAASIADFLSGKDRIVKTFEQPRDLQVGPEVTQYAPLEGDWEKTAELLLLVRPDYTIFDEIRRTKDFKVFGDMRLAGVGMIGVMHATNPVSAIQRFIGRMELGTIPHVIDTIIYINAGKIEKVYEIGMTVKVPFGMKDQDLARPVVEVRRFEDKVLEYEIYTYGEENVIMDVTKKAEDKKASPLQSLATEKIQKEFSRYDPNAEIAFESDDRITARVKNSVISRIIGKGGENIDKLEKRLGISINIEPKEGTFKGDITWEYEESGAYVNLIVEEGLTGVQVDVYSGEQYLLSAYVGKRGVIRVRKRSELGRKLMQGISSGKIRIVV
jgi:ATPase